MNFEYLCKPAECRRGVALLIFQKTKINTTMAKKLSVTPLQDRVIVKPAHSEEKTAGGIIIPDTAKEKPQRGRRRFSHHEGIRYSGHSINIVNEHHF
jgi:hypothetical protein